jgi:DnaJ-class molecular chaperone
MSIVDFTETKKEQVRMTAKVMCGSCKATGLLHEWNAEALLAPVSPPRACPSCNGTGKRE